jgi:DNA-directed RNA polymerase subunit RPC12/RpoP
VADSPMGPPPMPPQSPQGPPRHPTSPGGPPRQCPPHYAPHPHQGPPPHHATPPGTPPPLRATRHSTEQTRTYPCHRCGASLVFDIGAQQLKCPSCGNTASIIEDAGRRVVEHDLRAMWGRRASSVARFADASGGTAQKEIVCQNCGGHTTFTGTLTATRCPYCATPIQRDDIHDAPDRLPVDAVLPFRVDEPNARSAVETWIKRRWFAPSEFKKYKETGSFTSVYLAYFTYDATTVTDYTGERGDEYTVTTGHGEDTSTETRVDWTGVSGQVANRFDDVPVLANTGLDTKKVTALEPWPTQDAKPYSAEYIAGHLSRTYDTTVEQAYETAKSRMETEIDRTVRADIGGDQQRVHSKHINWYYLTFKHLLLPIWLLTIIYNGRPFQVCINGFTGEVQGRRPYSKTKIAITVAVIVVVLVAWVVWAAISSKGG